jgi:hypothetical protein
MRLRLLLPLTVMVLGACAAVDIKRPLSGEQLAQVHKVVVVSLLGDTFNGISIDAPTIKEQDFTASVADWAEDQFIESQTLSLLQETRRFDVAVLAHGKLGSAELRADHARRVWELAREQGFDTVVSIWPSVSQNFPFYKAGYGYFEQTLMGVTHRCLYAAYTVEVYDVATQRRMAWEWGGAEPCRQDSAQALSYRGSLETYSDVEKLQMRLGLESRFSETLAYALTKMGMLPVSGKAQP